MIESTYPNTEELMAGKRRRSALVIGWLILVTLLVVGAMTAVTYFYPSIESLPVYVIGLTTFVILLLPVLIWHHPQIGLYILFGGALLCPAVPTTPIPTMPASFVPFWWNLSSTSFYYSNTTALSAVIVSPAEILMLLSFIIWLVKAIVNREFRMERGQFFGAIAVYIGVVVFGLAHGASKSGCDLTIAMYEVRAQAYFFLAYLMTVNLITDVKQVTRLIWTAVFCVGFQGICGAITYFALNGNVSEDGFMAHDESLFLNLLFLIALLSIAFRSDRRLIFWSVLLFPTSLIAVLGNQRRAGIAALMIAMVPLLPMLWFMMKEQRKHIVRLGVILGIAVSIYMPIAWNATGAWALPARAIKSQTEPDKRDASSDAYRYAESFDLKATRDTSPWIGIGYGHRFLQPMQLAQVTTPLLSYMPHNSILWVWMRLGHLGFFCFYFMIGTVLIKGIQILKQVHHPGLRIAGILGVSMLLMMIAFGKFDLALVNSRVMFAAALLIGILSVLPKLDRAERQRLNEPEPEEDETQPKLSRPDLPNLTPDTSF